MAASYIRKRFETFIHTLVSCAGNGKKKCVLEHTRTYQYSICLSIGSLRNLCSNSREGWPPLHFLQRTAQPKTSRLVSLNFSPHGPDILQNESTNNINNTTQEELRADSYHIHVLAVPRRCLKLCKTATQHTGDSPTEQATEGKKKHRNLAPPKRSLFVSQSHGTNSDKKGRRYDLYPSGYHLPPRRTITAKTKILDYTSSSSGIQENASSPRKPELPHE